MEPMTNADDDKTDHDTTGTRCEQGWLVNNCMSNDARMVGNNCMAVHPNEIT